MRNAAYAIVIVMVVVASMGAAAAEESAGRALFYVAANGNDSWSGALAAPNASNTDGPFATLERARDEIRNVKKAAGLPETGVKVLVRGGVYSIDSAFELSARS